MTRRAAVVLLLSVLAAPAAATVLAPVAFDDLAREAHLVVHGRVIGVRAAWLPGRRGIERHVTVQVASRLKGSAPDLVTFRTPGGRMGRYRSVFVGAPEFQEGDEVVLFLRRRGGDLPHVAGLNQGVFRVVTAPGAGPRVLPPIVSGPPGEPARVVRGDPSRTSVALGEFAARVRRAVGDGPPR